MRRLAALLCLAFALPAVPAHADPGVDASFVDALTRAGIVFSDSASAVNAGKTACGLMDQGKSQVDIVELVQQQNSGLSMVGAAQFTAIAASAYCPQHLQRVRDNSGDPSQPPAGGMGGSGSSQH